MGMIEPRAGVGVAECHAEAVRAEMGRQAKIEFKWHKNTNAKEANVPLPVTTPKHAQNRAPRT